MIAAHRRRHRWMMALLALLLPLLVALALVARPAAPENAALPAGAAVFPDDRR
ncbi:MAG: hypothetical protein NDJ75_04915 [Thermoanaerobaculia bacterium]|nr:hypothetical protein [Thermoanaerobaculia bacterium]